MHHVPTNPTTIAAPSHINLGSILPFMACLNLPDLARLTNDPICHQTFWPPMPTKLPSDIPKFEGKAAESPQNHIMTFHLWCSSNNIMDDSIRLKLFQLHSQVSQPSGTLSFHNILTQDSTLYPSCSCSIYNSPSAMMRV